MLIIQKLKMKRKNKANNISESNLGINTSGQNNINSSNNVNAVEQINNETNSNTNK